MTWLLSMLLILGTNETAAQADDIKTNNKLHEITAEPKPDMELLLFLAEWNTLEGDQWLDPEVFTEDTEFNQKLDELKVKNDEKDSDNN